MFFLFGVPSCLVQLPIRSLSVPLMEAFLHSAFASRARRQKKDVRQHTHRRELRRVFGQSFIAELPVPPEVFDHPEWMIHLGSNS